MKEIIYEGTKVIKKYGNSMVIVADKAMSEMLQLENGDIVQITVRKVQ